MMYVVPITYPFSNTNASAFIPANATSAAFVTGYRVVNNADAVTGDLKHISPGSEQTGESACNDDNTCWGFSKCGDDLYLKVLYAKSSCSAYFSNDRAPYGYKEIPSTDFVTEDIHHYQLPADLCASECTKDGSCAAFTVCGDDCYMKALKGKSQCSAYIKE